MQEQEQLKPVIPTSKELLKDPAYFFCNTLCCILRKEVCVRRQKAYVRGRGNIGDRDMFPQCKNCEQGKKIRAEIEGKKICEMCGKIYEYEPAASRATKYYCAECMSNPEYEHHFDGRKRRLVLARVEDNNKKKGKLKVVSKQGGKKKMQKEICKECGKEFEPWKNGKSTIKTICRDCMIEKRKKRITDTKRGQLLIDFNGYTELHDYLVERAKRNFRDPGMEILAILNELKEQTP